MISVDWYAITCRCAEHWDEELKEYKPFAHELRYEGETSVYNKRLIEYDENGHKDKTYLWKPKSPIIPSDTMLCEIGNRQLYNGRLAGAMEELRSISKVSVERCSRVDLCYDFNPDKEFKAKLESIACGEIYLKGVRAMAVWRSGSAANSEIHCINWGAPESSIKWKLYNKTKEIEESKETPKTYIIKDWRENGLDERNVWRLEVSIKDFGRFVWDGRDILPIDVECSYIGLFLDLYERRFVLRKRGYGMNRGRDEKVSLFNLEGKMNEFRLRVRKNGEAVESGFSGVLKIMIADYKRRPKDSDKCRALISSIGGLLIDRETIRFAKRELGFSDNEMLAAFPEILNTLAKGEIKEQYKIPFSEPIPRCRVMYDYPLWIKRPPHIIKQSSDIVETSQYVGKSYLPPL